MALTANPSAPISQGAKLDLSLSPSPQEVPLLQPSHSFEGNDSETVIDVHLPGVQRSNISIRLEGQDLIILGKSFPAGKPVQPCVEYALHVRLDVPIDRKDVKAAMRSFDTLVVRIPAVSG